MSEVELEKVYKILKVIKDEFIDEGESRYYTKGWIEAEKEADAVYKKGALKKFNSVKELAEFIEKNVDLLCKG
jgi:hypothetical protein